MKINKVYIFTSESFPKGKAASNRILCYSKGFKKNGKQVKVICFWRNGQSRKDDNNLRNGIYSGISYQHMGINTYKSQSYFAKRLDIVFDYLRLFLFSLYHVDKNTLSIHYSHRTAPTILLWFTHYIKNATLIKEVNEHPTVFLRKKNAIQRFLFLKVHFKLFHGFLIMTDQLVDYFRHEQLTRKPILKVPMTVDLERFSKANNNSFEAKEIVYAGQLDDKKDGIDILLKAFKDISKKNPDFFLSLYGKAFSEAQMQKYIELTKLFNIQDKVIFRGLVDRETITERLLDATILVLPRPDSVQAQHGFPTKLGEYLATANPVIATGVGDISKYLKNEENIFLIKSGDVDSLIEKLDFVIANYEYAKQVGVAGRDFVKRNFDITTQSKLILSFCEKKFVK